MWLCDGADISATTNFGFTLLHAAAMRNSTGVLTSLDWALANDDFLLMTDNAGRTAFDVACLHSFHAAAEQLSLGRMGCPPQPVAASVSAHDDDCTFDSIDAHTLTARDFIANFLVPGRPLLIRGALTDPGTREPFPFFDPESWSLDAIKASPWGRLPVAMGEIPYAASFGSRSTTVSLAAACDFFSKLAKNKENTRQYVFESIPLDSEVTRGFSIPTVGLHPSVTGFRPQKVQLSLGAAGSGAPLHFHSAAVNLLIRGAKRWSLVPPSAAHYSSIHPAEMSDAADENLRPLKCLQRTGDVIFVPDQWAHQVLNLEESVGFAAEVGERNW